MKIQKFLIAGGNSTLLAWNCPNSSKNKVINKYLGKFEQVGFVEEKILPKLNMMGDELCINSTIALASQLEKSGKLLTSGIKKAIKYKNINDNTYIAINIDYKRIKNIILLTGIGFLCTQEKNQVSKELLLKLANKYSLPAFGMIFYKKDRITPYVYVKETDSLFKETACGSGSIACALATGFKNIIQPTGEIISVSIKGNEFTVGAKVVKIGKTYE